MHCVHVCCMHLPHARACVCARACVHAQHLCGRTHAHTHMYRCTHPHTYKHARAGTQHTCATRHDTIEYDEHTHTSIHARVRFHMILGESVFNDRSPRLVSGRTVRRGVGHRVGRPRLGFDPHGSQPFQVPACVHACTHACVRACVCVHARCVRAYVCVRVQACSALWRNWVDKEQTPASKDDDAQNRCEEQK